MAYCQWVVGLQRSSGTGRSSSPACTPDWSPPHGADSGPCCMSGGRRCLADQLGPVTTHISLYQFNVCFLCIVHMSGILLNAKGTQEIHRIRLCTRIPSLHTHTFNYYCCYNCYYYCYYCRNCYYYRLLLLLLPRYYYYYHYYCYMYYHIFSTI